MFCNISLVTAAWKVETIIFLPLPDIILTLARVFTKIIKKSG